MIELLPYPSVHSQCGQASEAVDGERVDSLPASVFVAVYAARTHDQTNSSEEVDLAVAAIVTAFETAVADWTHPARQMRETSVRDDQTTQPCT